jgi:hypothetical protein
LQTDIAGVDGPARIVCQISVTLYSKVEGRGNAGNSIDGHWTGVQIT